MVTVNKTGTIGPTIPQEISLPSAQVPVVARDDQGNNLFTREWYIAFEKIVTRLGGTGFDKVNDAYTGLAGKVDTTTEVIAGTGLEGGGALTASVTLSILPQTGWTFGTGTASKGAWSTYAGQTWGVSYSQSIGQALDNAVVTLAQKVLALEQALKALGAITT